MVKYEEMHGNDKQPIQNVNSERETEICPRRGRGGFNFTCNDIILMLIGTQVLVYYYMCLYFIFNVFLYV